MSEGFVCRHRMLGRKSQTILLSLFSKRKEKTMSNEIGKVRVTVEIEVDIDKLSFPKEDGKLIWSPPFCVKSYISHSLFKKHDASYMGEFREGFRFIAWDVLFTDDFAKRLDEIAVEAGEGE